MDKMDYPKLTIFMLVITKYRLRNIHVHNWDFI